MNGAITITEQDLNVMIEQAVARAFSARTTQQVRQPSPIYYGKFREAREKYITHPDGILQKAYSPRIAWVLWHHISGIATRYAGADNAKKMSLQQADIAGELAIRICEMLMESGDHHATEQVD